MAGKENEDPNNEEKIPAPPLEIIKEKQPFTIPVLKLIKEAQAQHGLRHGDYQRYRSYCSQKLHRLRKALHVMQGDKKSYKKKEVTVEMIKDERHLHIPLFQAERSWSYAMQLKQESNTEPRKKFHLISRLKKAVKHVTLLETLCQSDICDARTKLEAQAYAAWMRGNLAFELHDWPGASEELHKAQTIYEKLSNALNEDDRGPYKQKLDELAPSLRYCAYNIGDVSAQDDLLKMRGQGGELADTLDALIAQTREKEAASLLEVTWRGRTVPIRSEKLRLFLLSVGDLEKSLARAQAGSEGKVSVYESLLLDCRDCIQHVKDELNANPTLKNRAPEEGVSSLQYLLSHLTYLRVVLTVDRNLLLIEAISSALQQNESKKSGKPQDIIRLLEQILQLVGELNGIPGLETDQGFKANLDLVLQIFKGVRCYYMALAFQQAKHWAEASVLYNRVEFHASAVQKSQTKLDKDFQRYQVQKQALLDDLLEKSRTGKITAQARSLVGIDDSPALTSDITKLPLLDRLDVYYEDPSYLTNQPNVVKLPPDMIPIPCKPLFFDLALNHIKLPSLEHKLESKKAPAAGGGLTGLVKGLWGWGGKK
nr:EOG090X04NF [Lepidurus arcticus]